MRAAVYERYGGPEVLQIREVPTPELGPGDVLVRVHAASINSWDWDLLTGKPYVFRFWGVFKPKFQIPGADIAGRVEAVGSDVTRFRVGDEVFGDLSASGWGGYAEYARAPETALCRKPSALSFERAAALPQAGAMALQALRDEGDLKAGQRVLITGAAGGVGSFATQLAKLYGAHVTAVDRRDKLDHLRALGADEVLDYQREDFAAQGRTYDLIVDVAAHRSLFDCARVLAPHGRYVMLGGAVGRIFQLLFVMGWLPKRGQKMRLMPAKPNHKLEELGQLYSTGDRSPCIERCYPLEEIGAAFTRFGSAAVRGKLVIQI